MKKKVSFGEVVGRGAGGLLGVVMIVLALLASPFVLWMTIGDDEGSSWSIASIIAVVILIAVFAGGVGLLTLATKRKNSVSVDKQNITLVKKCECGTKNPIDFEFCSDCGKKITNKTCECGAQNSADAKYCNKCGKELK